jgi:hypothetical protein
LLAPTVKGLLNNANLTDRVNPLHSLPDKNFNLPQLRHYFFWFGSFVRHF